MEGGEFVVEVGASSRDLRGSASVQVEGEPLWGDLTRDSTYAEWAAHPVGSRVLHEALGGDARDLVGPGLDVMIGDMPIRVIAGFGFGGFDLPTLDRLIEQVRAA